EARSPDIHSALRRQPLDPLEPPPELLVRPLERSARVDRELAREIHDGEEEIADLFRDARERGAGRGTLRRQLRLQLLSLFPYLLKRPAFVGPVERQPG